MSIVQTLSRTTLQTLISSLGLQEVKSGDQPYRRLHSPLAPTPVGEARLFRGPRAERVVYIGLEVPMIHLDSHMIFCFTAPSSLVPHFTLDAVHAGDHHAFHLDLIPRVDLAVNLAYMRDVYGPLTAVHEETQELDGLSKAHLSPLQLAVMSPWMLAHRATAAAMDGVGRAVARYLAHWQTLQKDGLERHQDAMGQNAAARDHLHRSILFSREVDPVWSQVDRLLGQEATDELRRLLLGRGLD